MLTLSNLNGTPEEDVRLGVRMTYLPPTLVEYYSRIVRGSSSAEGPLFPDTDGVDDLRRHLHSVSDELDFALLTFE